MSVFETQTIHRRNTSLRSYDDGADQDMYGERVTLCVMCGLTPASHGDTCVRCC